MKLSETPENLKNSRDRYIDQRWKQLYELSSESSEKAISYLIITNSGGAIAILSFLGASEELRQIIEPKIALLFFVSGVILVGILRAILFHRLEMLFEKWRDDVLQYMKNSISWENIIQNDEKRTGINPWEYLFGYGALICFIFGCIFGGIALFAK